MGPRWLDMSVCTLGAIAALAGCSSSNKVARRDPGVFVGNQGGAWEVVMAAEDTAAEPPGAESARRDGYILTHAGEGSDLPGDAWPDDGRDQLDDLRFVYLPRSSRDVVYFGRGPAYYPRRWYGW
jgi:hypothetical protein